jgi:transposase
VPLWFRLCRVRKLALKERAALAKWIVQTLDDLSESELEALWAEEAERRLDELEQGVAAEISAERHFAERARRSRETRGTLLTG